MDSSLQAARLLEQDVMSGLFVVQLAWVLLDQGSRTATPSDIHLILPDVVFLLLFFLYRLHLCLANPPTTTMPSQSKLP